MSAPLRVSSQLAAFVALATFSEKLTTTCCTGGCCNKVARDVHRDGGLPLVVRRVRVDAEFIALRVAGRVEPLRVHAVPARPVLAEALPGDDEVAVGVHRDCGTALAV